jgi:excisionase family DNA binding protein
MNALRLGSAAYLNRSLTTAWEHDSRILAQRIGSAMHTPRSAARAAGVSKSAIYRAIKTRRLPAYKLNGGSYAIYPAELLRAFPSMAQAAANAARQSSGSFSFPMWDVS